MSKKRAGHQAAANLVKLDDAHVWIFVEKHTEGLIQKIDKLTDLEFALEQMGTDKEYFTKDELVDTVVLWKHTVGQLRSANLKYLETNSDADVRMISKQAIALARKIQLKDCLESSGELLTTKGEKAIKEAITTISKPLKGVGPATSSAMLTVVRPDIFCYMYDEAIDCFSNKRKYDLKEYVLVAGKCLDKAQKMGHGWTTHRVAKTIWTAARYLAIHGKDLTKEFNAAAKDSKGDNNDAGGKPSSSKRPKLV